MLWCIRIEREEIHRMGEHMGELLYIFPNQNILFQFFNLFHLFEITLRKKQCVFLKIADPAGEDPGSCDGFFGYGTIVATL